MQKMTDEEFRREVRIWFKVYVEPQRAEIDKVLAELELAKKGLTAEQRDEIKGMDEMILIKEQHIAELETVIPRLEAEAAEARATHAALLAEHNSIAAQIDRVRQLINS
jgi:hypothetical protein